MTFIALAALSILLQHHFIADEYRAPRVKMQKLTSELPMSNFLAQIKRHQDFHDLVIIEMPYQGK